MDSSISFRSENTEEFILDVRNSEKVVMEKIMFQATKHDGNVLQVDGLQLFPDEVLSISSRYKKQSAKEKMKKGEGIVQKEEKESLLLPDVEEPSLQKKQQRSKSGKWRYITERLRQSSSNRIQSSRLPTVNNNFPNTTASNNIIQNQLSTPEQFPGAFPVDGPGISDGADQSEGESNNSSHYHHVPVAYTVAPTASTVMESTQAHNGPYFYCQLSICWIFCFLGLLIFLVVIVMTGLSIFYQTRGNSPTLSPKGIETTTQQPDQQLALSPTLIYTYPPTIIYTLSPTETLTLSPSKTSTLPPTKISTLPPTETPTLSHTKTPTLPPTKIPTLLPTKIPTLSPTKMPTPSPTMKPTLLPTPLPTRPPTIAPTFDPICKRIFITKIFTDRDGNPEDNVDLKFFINGELVIDKNLPPEQLVSFDKPYPQSNKLGPTDSVTFKAIEDDLWSSDDIVEGKLSKTQWYDSSTTADYTQSYHLKSESCNAGFDIACDDWIIHYTVSSECC